MHINDIKKRRSYLYMIEVVCTLLRSHLFYSVILLCLKNKYYDNENFPEQSEMKTVFE